MKTLPVFLLVIVALSACKEADSAKPSSTASLTAKNWRLTAFTVTNGTTRNVRNLYDSIPVCIRDNFIKFNPDQTALLSEGVTKCYINTPQELPSQWVFINNETQLLGPFYNLPYLMGSPLTIVELSATTLHLRDGQSKAPNFIDITFSPF